MKQRHVLKSSIRQLVYVSFDLLRFLGIRNGIFWAALAEQRLFKTGYYHTLFLYAYRRKEFDLCTRMMETFVDNLGRQRLHPRTAKRQQVSDTAEKMLSLSMAYFFDVTNAAGFQPFIAFGTLLGFVRDQRFIPWDRDLDIGLFYDETDVEKLIQVLNDSRFIVTEYTGSDFPCKIKCRLANHPPVDIVFFKHSGDMLLTAGRLGNGEHLIRKRTPFRLIETEYYGVPIRIPEHPEDFLAENYGDWKKQKVAYHHVLDSKLTDYRSTPDIRYFAMAVLLLHLQRNNYQAVEHYIALFIEKMPEDCLWLTIKDKLYACNYLH